jgi:nicotinamide mononucleotide transporter
MGAAICCFTKNFNLKGSAMQKDKGILSGILHWTPYEIIWLFLFCGMAVFITLATGDNFFGFLVFLSGVLCVLLAAKGSILNYPAGTFNCVGYSWIAWHNGLWGEVGLNMLFYFPMNVVGFLMWRGHVDQDIVRMRKMGLRGILILALICVVSIAAGGFALSLINEQIFHIALGPLRFDIPIPKQNSPFIDASTNVLSIIATILMVKRFREQWLCYISLNILSVVMWSIRWANNSPDGPLMVLMWSAYLINAFYGMYKWTKGANAEALAETAPAVPGTAASSAVNRDVPKEGVGDRR